MLCISLAEDASIIKNVEIAIKNKVTIIVIKMVKHAYRNESGRDAFDMKVGFGIENRQTYGTVMCGG